MNTDITAILEINWAEILPFVLPVIIFNVLLVGVALFDWFKRRSLIAAPFIWLIVIILVQSFGPILYLVIGRRIIKNDYSQGAS